MVSRWPELAGKGIASGLVAVDFDKDTRTLPIRGKSAAWAAQGRLLAGHLIKKINNELGSETVRTILISTHSPKAPVPLRPLPADHGDPLLLTAAHRQDAHAAREDKRSFAVAQDSARRRQQGDIVRARALARAATPPGSTP